MREIPRGYGASFTVEVTEAMTVDFEELGRVHPVYATYWMAKHMEVVGRKILVPFLEEGEEGIGSAVTVRHLAPAFPGERLRVEGTHDRTEGNRLVVRCRVVNRWDEVIGEGETTQVVLPTAVLAARFARQRARLDPAREEMRR
ncbi:MAG: thioesterase family protein [Sphaerobacter sp.]|nr:thioesterase family protein [Sphaerobacter sp.]